MPGDKIKVLVVEDSLVFRTLLVKYINQDPELQVVAVAGDAYEARDAIIRYQPDVMTLDIELPKMSGIEFLRKLMPQYPIRAIVISTLSNRVFDALQAGAVDFVAKPAVQDRSQLDEFVRSELPGKIKIAARAKLKTSYGRPAVKDSGKSVGESTVGQARNGSASGLRFVSTGTTPAARTADRAGGNSQGGLSGLPRKELAPSEDLIVAIGASTGGTEATSAVLETFGPDIPGVVITQHMPEGFTKMYADRLQQRTHAGITVKEAEQGDAVLPGHIYVAPGGDRHMEIVKKGGRYHILLKDTEKVNGHKPSVDVLFDSVARQAGENAVGIILTGMGGDGAKGLLAMRQAGARTIGQDESTCVVYGMPRVAYELGAVEAQEKLQDITRKMYYFLDQIQRK